MFCSSHPARWHSQFSRAAGSPPPPLLPSSVAISTVRHTLCCMYIFKTQERPHNFKVRWAGVRVTAIRVCFGFVSGFACQVAHEGTLCCVFLALGVLMYWGDYPRSLRTPTPGICFSGLVHWAGLGIWVQLRQIDCLGGWVLLRWAFFWLTVVLRLVHSPLGYTCRQLVSRSLLLQ